MSGNEGFEMLAERGWQRGMRNMLNSEFSRWWKTRMWWVQSLIWTGIMAFILGAILFSAQEAPPSDEIAMLYGIFAGLFPAVGVVIIMQGVVVGEKKEGTAAWVLSKPVTRPAFLVSKVVANSLGILATMVVLPGIAAYVMQSIAKPTPWDLLGFIAAMGVIFISNFFYMSLTLMLGTFFSARGPVIGIGLALIFIQQYLVGWLPMLRYFLPWNFIMEAGGSGNAVVSNLMMGTQNFSWVPVIVVALESILFLLIGIYRFNREEF
jgi:ABC-2 type transport system permease protein